MLKYVPRLHMNNQAISPPGERHEIRTCSVEQERLYRIWSARKIRQSKYKGCDEAFSMRDMQGRTSIADKRVVRKQNLTQPVAPGISDHWMIDGLSCTADDAQFDLLASCGDMHPGPVRRAQLDGINRSGSASLPITLRIKFKSRGWFCDRLCRGFEIGKYDRPLTAA